MSRAPDNIVELSETLTLCEYKSGGHRGFWLHDATRGMNLAICAKTETDALVEALHYYQRRLVEVEVRYSILNAKVKAFIAQVVPEDDMPEEDM